jgi:2,3-dihydroxybenzoate decarboxylase
LTADTLPDRSLAPTGREYLRIATEEAFAPPELITTWRTMIETGSYDDPGFISLVGFYTTGKTERSSFVFDRLQDLGADRRAAVTRTGSAA